MSDGWPDLSYLDRCPVLMASFCPRCSLILPTCEYGQHQQQLKWSVGLCKCEPEPELPEFEQMRLI